MKKAKLMAALAALFLVNILLISLSQQAEAVAYKQGSSGSVVSKIQQALKSAGYYTYAVDGIYGSRTTAAVKKYQRAKGLTVDGICGTQTLSALGISVPSASADRNTRALLARLISAEARGEPYVGQVAVGAVVLNRVKHPSFPNTIPGVIYQSGAFSCIADGQFDQPVAESAYRAADDALNGWDPTGGAIYYFNPSTATSAWIWSRPLILTIGKHRFCA
ncbi:MAG: spore cortex-lytic enzyme [Oscillospiraceae bacterium]|nr:spore cortex-lytic enzyme [Oscillospiraceae bacterium]